MFWYFFLFFFLLDRWLWAAGIVTANEPQRTDCSWDLHVNNTYPVITLQQLIILLESSAPMTTHNALLLHAEVLTDCLLTFAGVGERLQHPGCHPQLWGHRVFCCGFGAPNRQEQHHQHVGPGERWGKCQNQTSSVAIFRKKGDKGEM